MSHFLRNFFPCDNRECDFSVKDFDDENDNDNNEDGEMTMTTMM